MTEKEKNTILRVVISEKREQLICNNQYFCNIFTKHSVTLFGINLIIIISVILILVLMLFT